MEDYSLIHCKGCGAIKKRIRAGRYANGKDTRWVDEAGKEWNGHKCPDCHRSKAKLNKRLNAELVKLSKKLD